MLARWRPYQKDKKLIQKESSAMRNINIEKSITEDIVKLGQEYGIERIVLFGSRARGDNKERSDIDLAISGGNTISFSVEIDERVQTLLMFDVVDLGKPINEALLKAIQKEGVVIYEKS